MNAPVLNHAARRGPKIDLYGAVMSALKSHIELVWWRELRSESMILGQLSTGQTLMVLVYLPGMTVPDRLLGMMASVNRYLGLGFIAREPGDVARWMHSAKQLQPAKVNER